MPFACAVLLTALGARLLARARAAAGPRTPFFASRAGLGRVLVAIAAMLGATLLLEALGFALTMLALLVVLARAIGRERWAVTILYAVVSVAACVALFRGLLGLPLPRGIAGF